MQIIKDIDKKNILEKSVVTIGTFDGLHEGHQEIFAQLNAKATELGLSKVVITFYPHPRTILAGDYKLKLLTPLEEKKELFKNFGIDYLFIISFSEEFSKKTYKEFFDEILIETVNVQHLVIGYDHKFGKDRSGDINSLIEYTRKNNIGMTVVGPKEIDSEIVSSTKIRNALFSGDVVVASKMLGRNYFLDGIVVEGAKRGRTLGFPTANLGLREDNKLIPKNGVYLVKVLLNQNNYFGVANIGLRPTFNHSTEPITEVYILDFDQDIYGNSIKVEFIERIRDEKKFSSKEELEEKIKLDVIKAKKLLKKLNK
jgi:riboflavin kinase/FMN adenylyltransferase